MQFLFSTVSPSVFCPLLFSLAFLRIWQMALNFLMSAPEMWKMSACLYEWVSVSVCVCAGVTLIYEHRPGIRQILSFSAVALCGGKCAFRRSQKMKIIFNGHSHEVSFSYHFFGYWYVSPSRVEHLNCIYAHASINQTIYQNMSFGDGWLW